MLSETPQQSVRIDARVCLVCSDKARARAIYKVLKSAVSYVDRVEGLPTDTNYDLIVTDYGLLKSQKAIAQNTPVLICADNEIRDDFSRLFSEGQLTNLVAQSPDVDGGELLVTVRKILQDNIFGLEKYFPWGTAAAEWSLVDSSKRDEVFEQIRTFCNEVEVSSRLTEVFVTAVDELVTNALYNAPVDAEGRHRFATQDRRETVTLEANEPISVNVASDGRRLGVSVSDPFGSLTSQKVLQYLGKCFRKQQDQIDTKDGGAGLGLYYSFEALSEFVINIKPKHRTEMIGLVDISGSHRHYVQRAKSFNIFVSK